MADQLLAREWMLAVGKPLEVFFTNFSDEPLEMRQLAVPDAANQIAFRVVVLARVLKLLGVMAARLSRAQRLRDREHRCRLLEEWLLSNGGRRRPFVGNQRLRNGRLNDWCDLVAGCDSIASAS